MVSKKRRKPEQDRINKIPKPKGGNGTLALSEAVAALEPEPVRVLDAFQNVLARQGYGTTNLGEGADYVNTRLTRDFMLLTTLYRSHWVIRKIVDVPAEDMCKNWITLASTLTPEQLDAYQRAERKTKTRTGILKGIKWGRLYGGAGALVLIKGHQDHLDRPLDYDTISPSSYRGLIVFDRWSGIQPGVDIITDLDSPDFGLPTSYQITTGEGQAFHVHASRILRFPGRYLPYWEEQAEVKWGISEIELVFDELKKRDNCYDDQTEILTRNHGFVLFKDLSPDDEVATRNVNREFEWQKPIHYTNEEYEGDMIHFMSSTLDICVTPNHRMLCKKTPSSDLEQIVSAEEWDCKYQKQWRVPVTSTWKGGEELKEMFFPFEGRRCYKSVGDIRMSGDDYCALLGAFLADGDVSENATYITKLEKSKGYPRYSELFDRIGGFKYDGVRFRLPHKGIANHFRHLTGSANKHIPVNILNLPARQLKILWDFYLWGDGSFSPRINPNGIGDLSWDKRISASSVSRRLVDNLTEVAQKIGYSLSMRLTPNRDYVNKKTGKSYKCKDLYHMSCHHFKYMGGHTRREKYKGRIYCVTVPNEIIYVRRNGRACWCGNTSWNIASLVFLANIRVMKMGDLRSMLATGNAKIQAQFYNTIAAQNHVMSNQGLLVLDKDDDYEQHETTGFRGIADVYESFMLDLAGAAEMPVTKLFGRSPAGMNSTGESDLQNYYDSIEQKQESTLRPVLEKLLPIVAMSEWGYIPEDLDFRFNPPATVPSDKLAELAGKKSSSVVEVFNAGLISQKTGMKELRQMADETGMWSNITDEDIAQADAEIQQSGEGMMGGGMPGMEGLGLSESGDGVPPPHPVDGTDSLSESSPTKGDLEREKSLGIIRKMREFIRGWFKGKQDPVEFASTDVRSPVMIYNQDPFSTRNGEIWCGFDVRIENPVGSFRSGVDSQGHMWQTQLENPYGFLNGVRGKDKDHLDVFLGPDSTSQDIFVIDQVDPYTHRFDEHKIVLGAHDIGEAKSIYQSNYQDGWQGLGAISKVSPGDFKEWVRHGGPRSGPYIGYSG